MPRTAARFTQADIARVVRAVAQARVRAVIEIAPEGTIRIIMGADAALPASVEQAIEEDEEIVM